MLKSGLTIALLLLLGRVAGFGREWVLANATGATGATDIAIVLLTFPDLIINLLLGGGLAAALVPAFKRLPAGADLALMLKASTWVGGAFAVMAVGLSLAAEPVLLALAPGLAGQLSPQDVGFFQLTNIALPLGAVSGVAAALLNTRGRFGFGAAGTLVFNIAVIGSIVWLGRGDVVMAIACGVVFGAALRLFIQILPLAASGSLPNFSQAKPDAGWTARFVGAFGFGSFIALLPPIARSFASRGDPGSLSLFNFAYKLMELPMALVISAIGTVMLTRIAGWLAEASEARARQEFSSALRIGFLILLAIAIPAAVYSEAMVRVIFFTSPFNEEQFGMLATIAALGIAALPVQGLLVLYATGFPAFGQLRPLIIAGILMLATLLAAGLILPPSTGVMGVMICYVGALTIGTAYLSICLQGGGIGINLIGALTMGGLRGLLAPAAGALVIGLAGRYLADTLWVEVGFGLLALMVFGGLHLWLDSQSRNAVFERLARRRAA